MAPQSLVQRSVNPSITLRAGLRRSTEQEARLAQGQSKVLQSSRAPAQLSLFERPCGGR